MMRWNLRIRAWVVVCVVLAAMAPVRGRVRALHEEQLPGHTVTLEGYLKRANPDPNDKMGTAVAVASDLALVGIPGYDTSTVDNVGRVQVFKKDGTAWVRQQNNPVKPVVEDDDDAFGTSVAISGNFIVVGAPRESSDAVNVGGDASNDLTPNSGAAYVFERVGNSYVQRAYLKASNTGNNDRFGVSVAIDGNTVVVGAPQEDSGVVGDPNDNNAVDAGAVYVFTLLNDVWTPQAYLKASNVEANDKFGSVVGIDGDTIVVGARFEDDGAANAGAAYVFQRTGTAWSQQAFLKAPQPAVDGEFGTGVAIAGDTIAVGSPGDGDGAVYVFNREQGAWGGGELLAPVAPTADAKFGFSVALESDRLVVGATRADTDRGLAYVFARIGGTWSQGAVLQSSDPGAGDIFGESVALAGDLVLVGAPQEDNSLATLPGDNAAAAAGAGYLFRVMLPVADGGDDATVEATSANGATIMLDGTGSSDPNGRTLSYTWTRISGTPAVLGYSAMVTTNAALGTHTFRLDIDNGDGGTSSDLVTVTVQDTTDPVITVTSPQDTWYDPGQPVYAVYSCQDNVGINFCEGTGGLLSGALLPGNWEGFSVYAADTSGNSAVTHVVFHRKKIPEIWPPSILDAEIAYPTPLGPAQLAFEAHDPNFPSLTLDGTWQFRLGSPSGAPVTVGTVLPVGNHVIFASFTPADSQHYTATGPVTWFINVEPYVALESYATMTGSSAGFGKSIAVSGDLMVIGAPDEDTTATNSGAAYVYQKSGTTYPTWQLRDTLKAHNPGGGDAFGTAVAISGNTIVVGAPNEDSAQPGQGNNNTAANAGAAYVFVSSNGTDWSQEKYLKASSPSAGDKFGSAVGIAGDNVVVGAPLRSSGRGLAYFFERSGTNWPAAGTSNGGAATGAHFGSAIAVSGSTLAIGAPDDGTGKVMLYSGCSGGWCLDTTISAPAEVGSGFGSTVAATSDTVLVGVTADSGPASEAGTFTGGAARMFQFSGSSWTETQFLRPALPTSGVETGVSVALIAETAVVTGANGAGVVWGLISGAWQSLATLAPSGTQGELHPVGIWRNAAVGSSILIGTPMPASGSGSVIVYWPQ